MQPVWYLGQVEQTSRQSVSISCGGSGGDGVGIGTGILPGTDTRTGTGTDTRTDARTRSDMLFADGSACRKYRQSLQASRGKSRAGQGQARSGHVQSGGEGKGVMGGPLERM